MKDIIGGDNTQNQLHFITPHNFNAMKSNVRSEIKPTPFEELLLLSILITLL